MYMYTHTMQKAYIHTKLRKFTHVLMYDNVYTEPCAISYKPELFGGWRIIIKLVQCHTCTVEPL